MGSLALLFSLLAVAPAPTTQIKVDQVGYLPRAAKVAFVVSATPADTFSVRRASDGSVAFSGTLAPAVDDADSGDRVRAADFTKLEETGDYYLDVPGVGRSWGFSVGAGVYTRAFYLAMRAFYGQRCGTAVELGAEFPGYHHAACHLRGAYHASSGKTGERASARGWHDAGDYGRYVVNSGIATGTLLWTWELFGARLRDADLHIPESGDPVPDILDEVRWNLDWMLTMQDADGGVWHKQTSEQFAPFVMPERDDSVSYVVGTGAAPYKSSCATADFAAVTAIAARVYAPFDDAYARKSLRAAGRAWVWLDKHPDVSFRNPVGVVTGEYGDRRCGDERLWASAELWRTTRRDVYGRYFLTHFGAYANSPDGFAPPSWANVAPLAMWTYVLGGGKDRGAVKAIREASLKAADETVERSRRNGYRTSLSARDYVWGSNGVAANYGVQLLVANAMRPRPRYVAAALDDLHYLLGRNTFSLCFVTRLGENPFRHPHHRPSAADSNAEPWPGLMSGGPNRSRQDPAMVKLPDLPPARMYLDEQESYATNEVAINWNAPLVFMLAAALPNH
ncbi:MAG: glycoside hydrolase family 9 protein [Acidobacteria bacterium]|nr:glycoside hydrolase family 9 protein [Acidobacteriota bacterium]